MTTWKPRPREQAKTKAELQEMLAKAVRNTQPQDEPKPLPKPKKRPARVARSRFRVILVGLSDIPRLIPPIGRGGKPLAMVGPRSRVSGCPNLFSAANRDGELFLAPHRDSN